MKIGISASPCDGGQSGISRYFRQMVDWLPRVGAGLEFELIAYEHDLEFLEPPKGMSIVPLPRSEPSPVRSILWHQTALPRIAASQGYDVLFLPAANRRIPFAAPCPMVGTVHDLASFHVTAKYDPWRDVYVRWVLPRLIGRLSHVIAVSRSSFDDVLKYCDMPSERVTIVHNGIDTDRYGPGDTAAARAAVRRLGVEAPYFLYVSRIEHPGKNHVGLIDAFAEVKRAGLPHRLVFAGADRERAAEVHAHARASGHAGDIHFLGFVPDDGLLSLYRAADALVFPSRFEGFGLPVLEAMACGVPVLCADVSSLPEVAGDCAAYFDPLSSASIAKEMMRVVGDADLRADLSARALRRSANFSIGATARRTLEVLMRAGRESIVNSMKSEQLIGDDR